MIFYCSHKTNVQYFVLFIYYILLNKKDNICIILVQEVVVWKNRQMPSKLKSKKTKLKLKSKLTTACWVQNDDGTLSLTIGAEKSNVICETSDVSAGTGLDVEIQVAKDSNNNWTNDLTLKSPQPGQAALLATTTTTTPTTSDLPLKILKSNWRSNGTDYRERQQTKRRDEMTAGLVDQNT